MTTKSLADYIALGDQISVPDGTRIFQPGDDSGAFLIVTAGCVRVEQTNAAGRTVVLYRVEAGDSCVLTTTCLLSNRSYSGYGYAEGDVSAVAIPAEQFRKILGSDPAFQDIVFSGFADRVGELTDVIDELLLHRTDVRLARWLSRHADRDIRKTQQELAQELGTVREVISRSLKSFERRGWIALSRGSVSVINATALQSYGDSQEM